MHINDEQYAKLRLLAKQMSNLAGSNDTINSIGIYLNNLLNDIHQEPKVCALCKKDDHGTKE